MDDLKPQRQVPSRKEPRGPAPPDRYKCTFDSTFLERPRTLPERPRRQTLSREELLARYPKRQTLSREELRARFPLHFRPSIPRLYNASITNTATGETREIKDLSAADPFPDGLYSEVVQLFSLPYPTAIRLDMVYPSGKKELVSVEEGYTNSQVTEMLKRDKGDKDNVAFEMTVEKAVKGGRRRARTRWSGLF